MTGLDHGTSDGKLRVIAVHCMRQDKSDVNALGHCDFIFQQNGSMTDASSLGSMSGATAELTKAG